MPKVIISFLIAIILLMIVIILSRVTYQKTQDFSRAAEESRNAIQQYDNIDIQLRSAELFSLTNADSLPIELNTLLCLLEL